MRDGEKCWLAGHRDGSEAADEPKRVYAVFEAVTVGEPIDGKQVVNTRSGGCNHKMLVTVPVERVYKSEEEAEARIEELKRDDRSERPPAGDGPAQDS